MLESLSLNYLQLTGQEGGLAPALFRLLNSMKPQTELVVEGVYVRTLA